MILAAFDIDGTLTKTTWVDGECYTRALKLEFGVTDINTTWSDYPHTTDLGITCEIFKQAFNRPPEKREILKLIQRFMSLLRETHAADPQHFVEITGAAGILQRLSSDSKLKVSIATGCWHKPAVFKLGCAKISTQGIPLSTSDQAFNREDIVLNSIAKARDHYEVDQFSKIVSIGDSVWDVKTARTLGLPFIGVGDSAHLTDLGARDAVEDYRDQEGFIKLLEEAEIPDVRQRV
ncbi:MAG: HAD family hydrolase [Deltaproteobacteria bacterium]|nr:HAD family hydrolase [Deltaproteobacteria bacterium]MBW2323805.1 HAD family hydrolase [Deltaproteobacteria bacterium]